MDSLGLQGYVPASGRGTANGTFSGTSSGVPVTIGFKVFWVLLSHLRFFFSDVCVKNALELREPVLGGCLRVRSKLILVLDRRLIVSTCSSSFTRTSMKPGTYTVTLYQGELEAGAGSVSISAGKTSTISLSSNLSRPSTVWSIGMFRFTYNGATRIDFYILKGLLMVHRGGKKFSFEMPE